VTFVTGDAEHYSRIGAVQGCLSRAEQILEVRPFDYVELERRVTALHRRDPIDGLLCLIDIRIADAARLAAVLGLRFLNPTTALALRDKFTVRSMLAAQGISQPPFLLALNSEQLRAAVDTLGLPVVVKPSDGYGSQNIATFLTADDLNPMIDPLDDYFTCEVDYGLGVRANGRLLVERHLTGQLIGCDTFSRDGKHVMLGINEKLMFEPPSCAIRGSCFPSDRFDESSISSYLFSILDALGFDQGAAHTEIIVGTEGPQLVEVNPRLVGAKIPRMLSAAMGRSVHKDLIALHLGQPAPPLRPDLGGNVAVTRWISAPVAGILDEIVLPESRGPGVQPVELLKSPGETVSPPYQNADRLGCILVIAKTREHAEQVAEEFVSQVIVRVHDQSPVIGGS
jgi:biotin carboxylase